MGINQSAVSRHIKNGRLTEPAINDEKKVNVRLARKQLLDNLDPARGNGKIHKQAGTNNQQNADDKKASRGYAQARAMKAVLDVKLVEMGYQEKLGNLIKKEDVFDTYYAVMRETRDNLFRIADRIGAIIIHQEDEHTAKQIINAEIRQALKTAEDKLMSITEKES